MSKKKVLDLDQSLNRSSNARSFYATLELQPLIAF